MDKKVKINLDEWDSTCGDGCCYTYGTEVTINGVVLENQNQDVGTILNKVLTHLGYEVELTKTYNGE